MKRILYGKDKQDVFEFVVNVADRFVDFTLSRNALEGIVMRVLEDLSNPLRVERVSGYIPTTASLESFQSTWNNIPEMTKKRFIDNGVDYSIKNSRAQSSMDG